MIFQDLEKREENSDDSDESDDEEEADKQMGETEDGAEKYVKHFVVLRISFIYFYFL